MLICFRRKRFCSFRDVQISLEKGFLLPSVVEMTKEWVEMTEDRVMQTKAFVEMTQHCHSEEAKRLRNLPLCYSEPYCHSEGMKRLTNLST
jgi:hypothetical protein